MLREKCNWITSLLTHRFVPKLTIKGRNGITLQIYPITREVRDQMDMTVVIRQQP
jgi:hypothetical protein